MINLNKNKYFLLCFFSFLISRLIFNIYYEISIDNQWVSSLWQHIQIRYLEKDLFSSLLLFHAQPPMWNFLLGLGIKISHMINFELYIKFLNHFFSIIIIYSSHQLLKNLNFTKQHIYYFILFFIILSPSILFYENFPSYAHFSCTLIFLIKLYFLKIYRKYKLKYEILIYFFSTLLILTWSAYIIYFNFLIFLILIPLNIKKNKFLKSLFIFIIFFMVGSLPSIKNKILFNIYSNSSWTGLNSSQATGYDRQNWPLCSFNNENILEYNLSIKNSLGNKSYLNSEILNDGTFNDLGYIFKSISCSNNSKKYLIKNFYTITKTKIKRFISVHAHLSIDFAFKPKNWNVNFVILEKLNKETYFKILIITFFFINYVFYLFILKTSFFKKNKESVDYFIIINFLLYIYLLLVSFYGSTWEQERMRYTEYSFIFISIILIFQKLKVKN